MTAKEWISPLNVGVCPSSTTAISKLQPHVNGVVFFWGRDKPDAGGLWAMIGVVGRPKIATLTLGEGERARQALPATNLSWRVLASGWPCGGYHPRASFIADGFLPALWMLNILSWDEIRQFYKLRCPGIFSSKSDVL